ncbi:hypothetical protein BD410DRAFT_441251 [Rickenella mellea]|uniref:Uncharacterized protein n=1 Tax=Rickenella mellea TaxID=50990 RepID=A0A4Y7PWL2_9AGAM|nr:hypothetical protein BD410DRAFT_441251 [Rickenella mellea]
MSRQIVTFNFNFGQTSQQNQLTVANGGGLWKRFFGGRRKLALDLLPADIIVDEIMSRLNMKDIGALRRVNWNLHLLTKQPAVWKRFLPQLPRMPFPLPALPPTAKYDRHGLCALDIERLVTRAITFDNNWLGEKCPQPYYIMPYATYQHLLSMVLLPGSHYMVASVVDGAGQYAVMVWAMEHPSCDGPVPLVIRYTEFKAYHLQAKYMTVSGEKGITISFLRKRHKSNTDTRDIPESLQAGGPAEPEDPYMPLKYDCTTLHITLNSLDILTDRRYKPGTKEFEHVARAQRDAIKKVSSIRTGRQLGALTLEEIDGAAYVAVVKRPDTIVLENLSTNVRTVIQCPHPQAYPNYDCQIWNLRLLPLQRQIFVIRTVTMTPTMANDVHLLELYDIPPFGTEKRVTANESRIISLEGVTNIQMSDLLPAPEGDESIWPMLSKGRLPPPITVYFCRERGVQVYCMWAKLVEIPASPPATPGIAQNIKKGKMKAVAEPQKWYYYTLEATRATWCLSSAFSVGA